MFNDHELELLISGLPEIDVDDLRANTEYQGFTANSPVIQYFWEVVREMDKEDLALLVQFVTGTSKVPLEGFKALQVRACALPSSALSVFGYVYGIQKMVKKCFVYLSTALLRAVLWRVLAQSTHVVMRFGR